MYNFKTGIFVNEWKNYESESALIKGLERAASLGVDGVQLSDMCRLDKADSSFRKNIKSAIDSLGLKVSAICGDIGIKFHNTERREELYDTLWRVYDIALELGTNIVTTHVGVVPADKTNPRYGVMFETFSHIAEHAASLGAYLANETGPETAPVLKTFLDDINSPAAAVNFDPANTAMSTGEKAEEAAKTLGKYIVHTHAKDGILIKHADLEIMYGVRRDPDFRESDYCREVLLGEGDVDWKKYLAALDEIGYTGYLTIEREGSSTHDADVEKEVPFLKALIAE